MTDEFVVIDKDGREVDWIDPYLSHRQVTPTTLEVDNGHHNYTVTIPEGGRYTTRPLANQQDTKP